MGITNFTTSFNAIRRKRKRKREGVKKKVQLNSLKCQLRTFESPGRFHFSRGKSGSIAKIFGDFARIYFTGGWGATGGDRWPPGPLPVFKLFACSVYTFCNADVKYLPSPTIFLKTSKTEPVLSLPSCIYIL